MVFACQLVLGVERKREILNNVPNIQFQIILIALTINLILFKKMYILVYIVTG